MTQTQTLTSTQFVPARDVHTSTQCRSSEVSNEAAELACDVFFARTAAAGPPSEVDRSAIAGSVIEIVALGSDWMIPDPPSPYTQLRLIVEGWAYRAHTLADGARQITDILLPGDLLGWSPIEPQDVEHEIRTSGRMQVAVLRRDVVTGRDIPSLQRRWEWVLDAEAQTLRSRLISLGRRDARGRVAHLMVELHDRLRQVGLVEGGAFTCPLTQEQLADVLGLTSVHVNRVLQRLRREGLVMFSSRRVVLPNLAGLHAVAGVAERPDPTNLGGQSDLLRS